MGELDRRPYSRAEYSRALVLNALVDPLNVVVLAGMLIAGLLVAPFLLVLPVALVVYGIAAARTYFDEDEAEKVLGRERERHKRRLEQGQRRLDPGTLAPPIARLVQEARAKRARVHDAIERAELPYAEVSDEVDGFVEAMEATAARAQLLYEALDDTPPAHVERRLGEARRRGGDELVEALSHQLDVQRRMEAQLARFEDEMERLLVELDTVRGNLVSVSASTEAASQQRLAGEVRGLREEMGSLAEGMSEVFEDQRDLPQA